MDKIPNRIEEKDWSDGRVIWKDKEKLDFEPFPEKNLQEIVA